MTWNFVPEAGVTLSATKLLSRDLSATDMRAFDGNTYGFEEHTKGYTLLDLSATYKMEKYGRFTVGIENLTNKQYVLSWSQVDFYKNYFAGRGRMTSVTYELTF